MPSKVLKFQSPYQVLHKFFPTHNSISNLTPKVFGCSAYVHLYNQNKLDPKSLKCIFLGYHPTQHGYRCYSPSLKKLFITKDVTFHEADPFYTTSRIQGENLIQESQNWFSIELDDTQIQTSPPPQSQPTPTPDVVLPELADDQNSSANPDMNQQETSINSPVQQNPSPGHEQAADLDVPIVLRKPSRSCEPYRMEDFVYYGSISDRYRAFITTLDNIKIPNTVEEAFKYPEWREATLEEMSALQKNNTWELTELPPGRKVVGCRWLFTVKHKADGSVERLKARLVAKGYTQSYGLDYSETFAPVTKFNMIRVLLSLATNLDWLLHQFDIKNAFLNGELEEEVYMSIPPGFTTSANANKVCRLRKSLYGLKQSPRAWFDKFTRVLKQNDFKQSLADHTLFSKHNSTGKCTILSVYVDDIVITGDDLENIAQLKSLLVAEFEVKDLGQLKYFLGMEVARSKNGISVSQRKYTIDLLRETGMLGCKPTEVPMDPNLKLQARTTEQGADKDRYQKLVGKLIYLAHTRPDIGFAVSMVSRFMNNPSTTHMDAVVRILRYLKSSPGTGLLFQKSSNREIQVFTDADWA